MRPVVHQVLPILACAVALLSAQTATFSGTTAFANAKRDITVWSTGIGFSF